MRIVNQSGSSSSVGSVASYSLLPVGQPENTVYQTLDDSMFWIYTSGRWRPIRSRIFNNLIATKDTWSFNPLTGLGIKTTKDEGSFIGFSGSTMTAVIDP